MVPFKGATQIEAAPGSAGRSDLHPFQARMFEERRQVGPCPNLNKGAYTGRRRCLPPLWSDSVPVVLCHDG